MNPLQTCSQVREHISAALRWQLLRKQSDLNTPTITVVYGGVISEEEGGGKAADQRDPLQTHKRPTT